MPARNDVFYYGAGPAGLPTSVLETASGAILNHNNTGLGLIEQSHRSADSTSIVASACSHLSSLLSIPENYTVLFTQGGGTSQFAAVVYNLVGYWASQQLAARNNDISAVRNLLKDVRADYLITGSWSKKAVAEAKRLLGASAVNEACNAFGDIPASNTWTQTPAENSFFSYYCDNETIDGVEFPGFPAALEGRTVVCDMSSNILSRRVDVSKYGIIYAGAQKNVGGAGVTLVIIRNDILANQPDTETLRALGLPIPPIMMHYPTLTKAASLYNTLPIFEVFLCREVMAGILERGGLEAQEQLANKKAEIIYGAIDKAGIYNVVPQRAVRSRMNISFRIEGGEEREKAFLKGAEERGLLGLKGHRSVGGLRASNYNSVSLEAAQKLADWIAEFAGSL